MKIKTLPALALSQRGKRSKLPPISDLMTRALGNPKLISLAAGFVDQATLPVAEMRKAFDALWADPDEARQALQYGTTEGHRPLREKLLAHLQEGDGQTYQDVSIEQFVVTSGSNQQLHLIADTLLDPGDMVICTAPTYLVFMGVLEDVGAKAFGVDMDDAGMVPESLEAALEQLDAQGELGRVKAIYLVSYYDNPSGMTTSVERRQQIVEIAHRWSREQRIHIIEDAAYRELRFDGPDIPSTFSFDEDHETVIYTTTFSKPFAPGIRLGWGVFPKELIDAVTNLKGNIDFGSPNLNQHLLVKIMELGLYEPHIEMLRKNYARKKTAMVNAADKYLRPLSGMSWFEPHGGLYLWLTLPEHIAAGPDGRLFDLALEKGVLYVPGQYCFPELGAGVKKNTIRLSFGVQESDLIDKGVELLAEAIGELM